MATELDTSGDFDKILDGAEQVSLKRRTSAEEVVVAKAWRFSGEVEGGAAGVTDVARHDIVWQFAWNDALPRPTLGDAIIDAAGACWTILSVNERGAKTRLRCLTRNLYLVHELIHRVDIEQAEWGDLGMGPVIVGWQVLRTAVPARIQLDNVTVDSAATPLTSTATYRVVLGDDLALDHNHRLVDADGVVYEVTQFAQAERHDVLPIATVVKSASP